MATPKVIPIERASGRGRQPSLIETLREITLEVIALEDEALDLVERALPLAQQLGLMARAMGPASGEIAAELTALLERHGRRHTPRRIA